MNPLLGFWSTTSFIGCIAEFTQLATRDQDLPSSRRRKRRGWHYSKRKKLRRKKLSLLIIHKMLPSLQRINGQTFSKEGHTLEMKQTKQIPRRKKMMKIQNLMTIKMERQRSKKCKNKQTMTLNAGMTCNTRKSLTPPKFQQVISN